MYYHYADSSAKVSDEHSNGLIDVKLNPAVKDISNKLSNLATDIANLNSETANLKKAVETLADNQSKETQKIIERFLGAAQTASPDTAAKLLNTAASLIVVARNESIPAAADFFQRASNDLATINRNKDAELRSAAFSTQEKLAEYRSFLRPSSGIVGFKIDCQSYPGAVAIGRGVPEVKDSTIINCIFPQQLDGIVWTNVLFINSEIYYGGGPVVLQNVRFIHCKFNVQPGATGFQLLKYATLDETNLAIKPKALPKPSSGL
jgi:hypothetical protein